MYIYIYIYILVFVLHMPKTRHHKNTQHNKNTKTKKLKFKETAITSDCTKRYSNIEKRYQSIFKKDRDTKKLYNKHQKILQHAFRIPFAPSKITPQSDFYTYINYRWIQKTEKEYSNKKTKNRYFVEVDIFRLTQNKVYQDLFKLVKSYIQTEKTQKRNLINNVYQSLLTLKSDSIFLRFKEMDTLHNSYIEEDNLWSYLAHVNENEIISWGAPLYWTVTQNSKNGEVYSDNIDMPRLSLYDYLLYLGDYGQTPKYIKYKKSVVARFIEYVNKIFDSCLGKNHGLQGKDVFDVEVEMLTAMGCDDIKNEDPEGYNKVFASEALEKYGFDWNEFSKHIGYKQNSHTPHYFICNSLNYLKCMCKILKDNWKTPKWKAYFFYIRLRQMIRFDRRLIHIYYEFNGKFLEGQPDPFPQSLYPIFGLSLTFNTFLTEEYISAYWNQEYVDFVQNLADDLLVVFKRIMKRNTWLSTKTKEYALKKLDHLQLVVARPKKLREDPLLQYGSDDAWHNMLLITSWRTKKNLELQNKSTVDIPVIDWKLFKLSGTQAYMVNAYYEMNKNKIYVPMAFMQKPFINLDQRDFEYNLARIGYTLGHEMSHSLDNTGSKYDYKGNLHNWWQPEDKRKYNEIVKDIIKQYETAASYDGIKFNAEITVGENMADISGMAICQEYLHDYFEVNEVIIPVRELNLKNFYVNYAYHQRQHIYKRALFAQLGTNPHPLDKYRTNCVLARLKIFRIMFNIKKGDNMWWPTNEVNSTIWN